MGGEAAQQRNQWYTRPTRVGSTVRYLGQEHLTFAHHLAAEKKVEEFVPGKNVVVKWHRVRKQNHWLDALYNACAAGQFVGVRLVDEPPRHLPPDQRPTCRQLFDQPQAERIRRW